MLEKEISTLLMDGGVSDVGFCRVDDGPGGLEYGVSLAVALSDAIIDEIDGAPTHTYFHHYRTVNAFIDQMLLRTGLLLASHGHRYITIAASQSINDKGWNYSGRYSHKKAAYLAGLGCVGTNNLFLHRRYGARVRLGTLFTDCQFETPALPSQSLCNGCGACVAHCPAGALTGKAFYPGIPREELFDPAACSNYMKKEFQQIGRGSVCGICMAVCPQNHRILR